jgi:hypothetical protein
VLFIVEVDTTESDELLAATTLRVSVLLKAPVFVELEYTPEDVDVKDGAELVVSFVGAATFLFATKPDV